MKRLILVSSIVGVMGFAAGAAFAFGQPHMEAAMGALQSAHDELLKADANRDHGGHAEAATRLVEQAMGEVQAGIDYRNQRF